jgi:hypothetical protein
MFNTRRRSTRHVERGEQRCVRGRGNEKRRRSSDRNRRRQQVRTRASTAGASERTRQGDPFSDATASDRPRRPDGTDDPPEAESRHSFPLSTTGTANHPNGSQDSRSGVRAPRGNAGTAPAAGSTSSSERTPRAVLVARALGRRFPGQLRSIAYFRRAHRAHTRSLPRVPPRLLRSPCSPQRCDWGGQDRPCGGRFLSLVMKGSAVRIRASALTDSARRGPPVRGKAEFPRTVVPG